MPTPRFKDLRPEQAVAVLDAFLGKESPATFSEKLAGQNLVLVVLPTGEVLTGTKSSVKMTKGMFPEVSGVVEKFHPPIDKEVRYAFEILRRRGRPDYIDYKLPAPFVAVEFSGRMRRETAEVLNAAQSDVKFYTKEDIDRPVAGLDISEEQRRILGHTRASLASGDPLSVKERMAAEGVLMDLLDSGSIPSSVGGVRIEGLFGRIGGANFKIPSRLYADVQRSQSGIYAVVRHSSKSDYLKRFMQDPAGRHVHEVLEYLRSLTTKKMEPGFRTFFTPEEAAELLKKSEKEIGAAVYDRVSSREWPSTDPRDADVKSENNRPRYGRSLLKEYIRAALYQRVR